MNPTFQKSLQTQIEVLEREITPRRLKSISYLCSDEESLKKLQEFAFGDDWNSTRKKNETGASESECTCGLPNKKYCMLTSVSRKGGGNHKKKIVWAPMSICKVFSSSTPTVPYSTADILYGNEVNGAGRSSSNDDPRQNSFGELERGKSKSRDLDNPSNRRPNSRNGKQKAISIDTVTPFDKDREDPLKSLSASLPPAKPSHHYRPNGIRSGNKGEQLFSSAKQNGAVNGREQDDLVAMGTLWSPNNGNGSGSLPPATSQSQQGGYKSGPVSNSNMNSYPSKVAPSSSGVNSSLSSSNNTLNSQRKYPTGNSMRPIVLQNNVSGRKTSNAQKEQEDPKYTDPMLGAPASFQQRIIELGALEGDTVRWERTKRLKKKKQDRDS